MHKILQHPALRKYITKSLLCKRTIALPTTERHIKLSTRDKNRASKVWRVGIGTTGSQELRQCGGLADRMRIFCCFDLIRRGFEERIDVREDVGEGDIAGVQVRVLAGILERGDTRGLRGEEDRCVAWLGRVRDASEDRGVGECGEFSEDDVGDERAVGVADEDEGLGDADRAGVLPCAKEAREVDGDWDLDGGLIGVA